LDHRPLQTRSVCREALAAQPSRQVGAIVHAARLKSAAFPVIYGMSRQYLRPVPNDLRKSRFRVAAARVFGCRRLLSGGACNTACLNACSALSALGVRPVRHVSVVSAHCSAAAAGFSRWSSISGQELAASACRRRCTRQGLRTRSRIRHPPSRPALHAAEALRRDWSTLILVILAFWLSSQGLRE
jgi:hypothetical protein